MDNQDLIFKARRITLTLFTAQSLGSAGFIAAATLNSIVGADLGGNTRWAGVPSAVYLLGGAGAAFLWGKLMDILGRRNSIVLGLIFGVVGASLAAVALEVQSMLVFLTGMILMGIANAALMLGRFAAAEVHFPEVRGRAISTVVLGGTIGAVLGPLLVGPSSNLMATFHFNMFSGVYMASAALFAVASVLIFIRLRPDPLDLGKIIANLYPETVLAGEEKRSIPMILRQPTVLLAMLTMVLAQMVMVMVMVITALHMKNHQHALGNISFVISAHTLGMYAFSIFSGRLADRYGRGWVILFGAFALILACLAAPLSPHLLPLAVSLFLLGFGWNFCFVGGSALLADQLSPLERGRIQGINDFLVGLGSTVGSLGSGFVFAAMGFGFMAMVGAGLATLLMVVVGIWIKNQPRINKFVPLITP